MELRRSITSSQSLISSLSLLANPFADVIPKRQVSAPGHAVISSNVSAPGSAKLMSFSARYKAGRPSVGTHLKIRFCEILILISLAEKAFNLLPS